MQDLVLPFIGKSFEMNCRPVFTIYETMACGKLETWRSFLVGNCLWIMLCLGLLFVEKLFVINIYAFEFTIN